MTDLVTLVMQAAATEALQEEADQIDQEVQRLLVEMERASVGENRGGGFAQRFLVLPKRRGEVARKALFLFKEPQSAGPRTPAPRQVALCPVVAASGE
jgi:hypothetical protein